MTDIRTQPAKAIARLLAEARGRFGMEIAFVSEFENGWRIFRHVSGSAGTVCLPVGAGDPLENSYCARIVAGTTPSLIHNAQVEPSVADLPATHALQIGAHVSVPIVLSDGRVYGTFCCFSRDSNGSLTDRDVEMLTVMASLVAIQLEADELQSPEVEQARFRTQARMEDGVLTMVFQPGVRLSDGEVVFYEALARFNCEPACPPDECFAEAWIAGVGAELELFAMSRALEHLGRMHPAVKLSLNLSPETVLDPSVIERLQDVDCSRVMLEITEHAAVLDYPQLHKALAAIRALGVSIAIDDVGSGYSGLRSLLELKPDVLKLDMSITRGIHTDRARQMMAEAIGSFARDSGLLVVAEGVESCAEADTLQALGIAYGQGYQFGKPLAWADTLEIRTLEKRGPAWQGTAVDRPVPAPTPMPPGEVVRIGEPRHRAVLRELVELRRAARTLAERVESLLPRHGSAVSGILSAPRCEELRGLVATVLSLSGAPPIRISEDQTAEEIGGAAG